MVRKKDIDRVKDDRNCRPDEDENRIKVLLYLTEIMRFLFFNTHIPLHLGIYMSHKTIHYPAFAREEDKGNINLNSNKTKNF